ncbi:MAG: rod-binding protein [Pseudomonadota bacterium]|nr:rod-binding protein [Pseudomonadota bacterium]MDE3038372.1 rod-binding protein [Pseudomonadota bacterium]
MISAPIAGVLLNNSISAGVTGTVTSALMGAPQIDKVAKDFESMFVGQMLEQMFGESMGTDAFGDAESADIYKGLMTDAYGKEITNAGGIGIADYVRKELLKLQETKT